MLASAEEYFKEAGIKEMDFLNSRNRGRPISYCGLIVADASMVSDWLFVADASMASVLQIHGISSEIIQYLNVALIT